MRTPGPAAGELPAAQAPKLDGLKPAVEAKAAALLLIHQPRLRVTMRLEG